MRKISLLILISLLSQLSIAQGAGDLRISFVMSPQVSWINSDNAKVDSKGSIAGYNFGIAVDRFFGDNYAFATGLTINTTGGKLFYPEIENEEITIKEINQHYQLKYIEIPLGLRLRSEDIRRSNIYGRFGLSPQINIMAHDGDGNSISDEVRFMELGYHLGGGIEYSLGRRNALIMGVLYTNGFTDITNQKNYNDKAILNRLIFEFGFIF
jgi:hypothetical protein